ncbi:MAG: hypothetical protein AAGA54_20080 [Myxococcota bacterium]
MTTDVGADGSSTSDGTTGSTGSTGTTTTGSAESGVDPEACGDEEVCVSDFPEWEGPFVILVGPNAIPACPGGLAPAWTAGAGLSIPDCDCDCGEPDISCSAAVESGSDATCMGTGSVLLADGECGTLMGVSDGTLGVRAIPVLVDATCSNPVASEPTFESVASACALESAGDCGSGSCFPTGPAMQADLCLEWRGEGDARACPPGFPQDRTLAETVDGSQLDCDSCDCAVLEPACFGTVSAFVPPDCSSELVGTAAANASCEPIEGPSVDNVAGLRYDAATEGTCGSAGGKKQVAPNGNPTFGGVHQLCCL